MRITSTMLFNQITRALQKNLKALADPSERLSTGKRINKPSDDAIGMSRAMDYKVRIEENNQYMRNTDDAYSFIQYADTVMSSATSSLTRAKELAIQGATDTQSPESRASIAKEVASLRDEMLALANSKMRDRYIFSGYKIDTASFDTSFSYQGDSGEMNVMIDRTATVAVNIPGDTAFSSGGKTFMKTLDDLRYALENNIVNQPNPLTDPPGIREAITELDNDIDQVANVRADIGARLTYLDKQKTNLEDRSFTFKEFLSNTEDADITESVSEISRAEMALQSLRQSAVNIMSQSLLDFLG
jgi:flagellar hook-associated protein 3 FlgL